MIAPVLGVGQAISPECVYHNLFSSIRCPTDGDHLTAQWEIGQYTQHETGWRMFSLGSFQTVDAFVKAFNDQFGTQRAAKNFARDFVSEWMLHLHKTEADIKGAKDRMRALKRAGDNKFFDAAEDAEEVKISF